MGNIKKINTKNRTYFFFNDMINIRDFDSSLLKQTKKITQKYWYLSDRMHHSKKKLMIMKIFKV